MKCLFELVSGQEWGPIHPRHIRMENGEPVAINHPDVGCVLVTPEKFIYREPATDDEQRAAREQQIPDALRDIILRDSIANSVANLWIIGQIDTLEMMLVAMVRVLYRTKAETQEAFAKHQEGCVQYRAIRVSNEGNRKRDDGKSA